jgi:hypothetical protein
MSNVRRHNEVRLASHETQIEVPTLVFPTECIKDWPSFHAESARLFGFPEFYGKNMDAWIDCLSYLGEEDGMCTVKLRPGEVLTLRVPEFEEFSKNHSEVCAGLLECTAFVNSRYIEANEGYRIVLLLE